MPPPLGIAPSSLAPPAFVTTPTYTDLLNETLGDTASAFANMDSIVAALTAESAAFEADVIAEDATLASLDVLIATLDIGLPDTGPAPPIDPTLSYPAVDGYAATQGGAVTAKMAALTPLSTVPLVTPIGTQTITLGGPPSQGGSAHAGDPPYTLHFPLPGPGAFAANLAFDSFTGPNPPFTGFDGFVVEPGPLGPLQNTALLAINPVAAGTFTATLKFEGDVVITGISGHVVATQSVVIIVLPAVPIIPPPPPPVLGTPQPIDFIYTVGPTGLIIILKAGVNPGWKAGQKIIVNGTGAPLVDGKTFTTDSDYYDGTNFNIHCTTAFPCPAGGGNCLGILPRTGTVTSTT